MNRIYELRIPDTYNAKIAKIHRCWEPWTELQAKMSRGCRFLLFWHHNYHVTLKMAKSRKFQPPVIHWWEIIEGAILSYCIWPRLITLTQRHTKNVKPYKYSLYSSLGWGDKNGIFLVEIQRGPKKKRLCIQIWHWLEGLVLVCDSWWKSGNQ